MLNHQKEKDPLLLVLLNVLEMVNHQVLKFDHNNVEIIRIHFGGNLIMGKEEE